MYVSKGKFLILGLSKSGFSAAKHVISHGGTCYFYEENVSERIKENEKEILESGGINAREKVEDILPLIDVLIISPGVPINHEIAVKAKRLKKRIIGEFEFGYLSLLPPFIAVTGTNGKTTTVNMISSILNKGGVSNRLVGNVGVPLTSFIDDKSGDVFVAEVSSFQLEGIDYFCPHIACVLNISPDHLERHYSMENYVYLKKRLVSSLTESEYAILNYDDDTVRSFASQTKAKIVWVSIKNKVNGAYLSDGKLFIHDEFVVSFDSLSVLGAHNAYNALFAIAAASIMGVSISDMVSALTGFKGIKHRLELICDVNGVKFFNDSKSTNTASTIGAINCMPSDTVLILGGSEKGEKYDELFEKIKQSRVKHVVLTGASKYNMLNCASDHGYLDVSVTSDFINAVKIAVLMAAEGDCVLLSPACASFDCFKNYEERGELFEKTVKELTSL